jgi:hypothetical protein
MKIVDTETVEDEVTRGMRRRRARTGQAEKPVSRLFWIAVGAIATVVAFRAAESYFPRQPQQALPPPME